MVTHELETEIKRLIKLLSDIPPDTEMYLLTVQNLKALTETLTIMKSINDWSDF